MEERGGEVKAAQIKENPRAREMGMRCFFSFGTQRSTPDGHQAYTRSGEVKWAGPGLQGGKKEWSVQGCTSS